MKKKILVIDDDLALLTMMKIVLQKDGFEVGIASNGKDGIRAAYETRPDVIVLDVMMPELDGWQTCQRIRNICDTPILMVSAKAVTHDDTIKGIMLGADDYLVKPVSMDELKARIHAILRRLSSEQRAWKTIYNDGTLEVDLSQQIVKKRGDVVELTPTEQRLFMYLVSNKGRVIPHQELLVSIWGIEYTKEVGYLSVYIRFLREKLEDNPARPVYIRTRWGMGYYFAGDATVEDIKV
ncbi:MAG: response regulator transcription factor [Anaerolineae bacterium]|nr:response regulator transcription factor [Anaerolineae bacterium]